jgi:hypothetical protein
MSQVASARPAGGGGVLIMKRQRNSDSRINIDAAAAFTLLVRHLRSCPGVDPNVPHCA